MEHVCCYVFLPAHVFPSGLGNIPVIKIGGSPFPHRGVILNVGGCPKGSVVCDPTACDDDDASIISICSSTSTDILASSGKKPPCYVMIYQRPMMELLSPMVVMLEALGFNLCVAPFLNICVPNLLQGVGSGEC